MTCPRTNRIGNVQATQYATSADVCGIFTTNLDRLYLLSFLLTGDHEKAEQCFVSGLEDSIETNHVFRKWAHSWAKRTIVQNAIRVLQPSAGGAGVPSTILSQNGRGLDLEDFELYPVLALVDFERFVFVMTVLDRYSDQECALLISCSIQDIRETRVRALEHIAASATPAFSNRDSAVSTL